MLNNGLKDKAETLNMGWKEMNRTKGSNPLRKYARVQVCFSQKDLKSIVK